MHLQLIKRISFILQVSTESTYAHNVSFSVLLRDTWQLAMIAMSAAVVRDLVRHVRLVETVMVKRAVAVTFPRRGQWQYFTTDFRNSAMKFVKCLSRDRYAFQFQILLFA